MLERRVEERTCSSQWKIKIKSLSLQWSSSTVVKTAVAADASGKEMLLHTVRQNLLEMSYLERCQHFSLGVAFCLS